MLLRQSRFQSELLTYNAVSLLSTNMEGQMGGLSLLLTLLSILPGNPRSPSTQGNSLREEPLCVENSPERKGEFGCSIVEDKTLPDNIKDPVFWHIDRFGSSEAAKAAVGTASIAFEAHGGWWLMSVERDNNHHHGGEHVAAVKLSPLPSAPKLSMRALSAYIPPGMTSRVHFHSGVEAFYTVDGEQCLQTPDKAYYLRRGDTLVIPTGITMRLITAGDKPRRAFGLIVYDSAKPPTTRMAMDTASQLASCQEPK